MKYFVAAMPGPMPPTPEQFDAAIAWLQGRLDDGTFDCLYGFMEGGGFSIANADSHRDVLDMMAAYPLFGRVTFEVRNRCSSSRKASTPSGPSWSRLRRRWPRGSTGHLARTNADSLTLRTGSATIRAPNESVTP